MAELSVVYLKNHVIKERSDSVDSGIEQSDEVDLSPTAMKPSSIKNVAIVLGVYISLNISGLSHLDKNPLHLKKYKISLKTLVDKILQENQILFQRMIKSLKLTDASSSREAIRRVAKELFIDSKTNWGRILTLYAFVAELARYGETSFSEEESQPGEYAKALGKEVGKYVGEELAQWINKQGGWDKLETYSRKDSLEKKVFRGVMCTIFGIGIFATWKVMR